MNYSRQTRLVQENGVSKKIDESDEKAKNKSKKSKRDLPDSRPRLSTQTQPPNLLHDLLPSSLSTPRSNSMLIEVVSQEVLVVHRQPVE